MYIMKYPIRSCYKIHNQPLTGNDIIKKKKEKVLNAGLNELDKNYDNTIVTNGNKIVAVKSYELYNTFTKPKYSNLYNTSTIYRGHNIYKLINTNGNLRCRNISDGCTSNPTVETTYPEKI